MALPACSAAPPVRLKMPEAMAWPMPCNARAVRHTAVGLRGLQRTDGQQQCRAAGPATSAADHVQRKPYGHRPTRHHRSSADRLRRRVPPSAASSSSSCRLRLLKAIVASSCGSRASAPAHSCRRRGGAAGAAAAAGGSAWSGRSCIGLQGCWLVPESLPRRATRCQQREGGHAGRRLAWEEWWPAGQPGTCPKHC